MINISTINKINPKVSGQENVFRYDNCDIRCIFGNTKMQKNVKLFIRQDK